MKKSELLKKIENAKDDEDINSLLAGTDIEEQFKGPEPSLDVFKQKAKTDKVFKQFMEEVGNTYYLKAIKTMKEKGTWEDEFGDALKEKYPDLVKDPVQIELAKERKAREELEAKLARKDRLSDAIKYAGEKKIPVDFIQAGIVEKLLDDDLELTNANLDGFANAWTKVRENDRNEILKTKSYVPGASNPDGSKISIGASIAQQNNKSTTAASDPWASK